jgi:gamma-glutamylcysteine synthetase
MAFAVASQLDTSLTGGELASSSAAAQFIIDACLSDGPLGRVGLEIEAHCFDLVEPRRRPGWDAITDVIESLPPMPGGSAVTVAANRCVAAAAERVPAQLKEAMQQLVEAVERSRCPADDFSDRVIGHGIAPTVIRLAQGEL